MRSETMIATNQIVEIKSQSYWFKIVDFLQTNWALIDEQNDGTATVWFFSDTSGVFDQIRFETLQCAVNGLMDNGFDLYEKREDVERFLTPPKPPFKRESHPNGAIYSSGMFWKT